MVVSDKGRGRREYDMVLQDVTREGECIPKVLQKGPPTGHDMALQGDMTESKCTPKVQPQMALTTRGVHDRACQHD